MFGITFRPGGTHVQPVIVWRPVAIPLSIIVSPVIDDLVLAAGSSESLSAVEHPCRIEHPPFVQAVHAHDVDIMSAVIAGIIPPSTVDPVDTGLRPGEGVAEPARQPPVVLPHAQFHTIALSFSGQSQSLQFNLTAERLAVAVVEHILDCPVIAFHAEVVHLVGCHQINTPTPLVGYLRFHDITADGIAVEGCRRALVPHGVQVLRSPCITQFHTRLIRRLPADAGPGFQREVRLHDLIPTIFIIPRDITVLLKVVVK